MKETNTKQLVEVIDFRKLRTKLKTLMEEVDARLESEFDAFSPAMWGKLNRTVDVVILEIRAVRLALNGYTAAEVAEKLGIKKQQVAAFLAYNTMWQSDYASPETIMDSVDCPSCPAKVGTRCTTSTGRDARIHDSRREYFRKQKSERAMNTQEIRKAQKAGVAA
jgi:hypothetical protein